MKCELFGKYTVYVRDLFISYSKILAIKAHITRRDTDTIIKNIIKYLKPFSKLISSYLDELFEIMKIKMPKKIFLEIVVNVMEQLNECGKKCLGEMKKFCRYHSLLYFENSNLYFKKYIIDTKRLAACSRQTNDKCKEQNKYSKIINKSDSFWRNTFMRRLIKNWRINPSFLLIKS